MQHPELIAAAPILTGLAIPGLIPGLNNGVRVLFRIRKKYSDPIIPNDGQVAQLVEQRTENPRVGGSIPPLATTYRKARSAPFATNVLVGRDRFRRAAGESDLAHFEAWASTHGTAAFCRTCTVPQCRFTSTIRIV